MEPRSVTSREYFRGLKIVYFALLAGMIIFSGVALFLRLSEKLNDLNVQDPNHLFLIICVAVLAGGILGGMFLFKTTLRKIDPNADLRVKMKKYRSGIVLKFAMTEFPVLLSVFFYLASGDYYFLGIALLGIAKFTTDLPSIARAEFDLNLSYIEKQKLNNPDEIISEYIFSAD